MATVITGSGVRADAFQPDNLITMSYGCAIAVCILFFPNTTPLYILATLAAAGFCHLIYFHHKTLINAKRVIVKSESIVVSWGDKEKVYYGATHVDEKMKDFLWIKGTGKVRVTCGRVWYVFDDATVSPAGEEVPQRLSDEE